MTSVAIGITLRSTVGAVPARGGAAMHTKDPAPPLAAHRGQWLMAEQTLLKC